MSGRWIRGSHQRTWPLAAAVVLVALAVLAAVQSSAGGGPTRATVGRADIGAAATGTEPAKTGTDSEAGDQDVTTTLQLRSDSLSADVPRAVHQLLRNRRNDLSGASIDAPYSPSSPQNRACHYTGVLPAFSHAVTLDGRPAQLVVPPPTGTTVTAVLHPCRGTERAFRVPVR